MYNNTSTVVYELCTVNTEWLHNVGCAVRVESAANHLPMLRARRMVIWYLFVFLCVLPTMISELKTYDDVAEQLRNKEPNPGYYVALEDRNPIQKRQITFSNADDNSVSKHTYTHSDVVETH